MRSWPPSPKIVLPVALVLGLVLGGAIAVMLGAGRDKRRARAAQRDALGGRGLRAADA